MPNPKKAIRTVFPLLIVTLLMLLAGCGEQVIVMDPKGPIGQGQKDLILISSLLCAAILVPVLLLTAYIVWKYRDKPGNKASYKPNWSHSTWMETVWWGIPILVIITLGIITVKYTYALEPSKPIESEKKPLTVQVTSLDWKWLFMYPEQGIATVNYLQIPEDVPIKFELTSDAPMNSFWIPQLGGQMYTMSGMAMTLYLQADHPGKYYGSGANFSGEHFADMTFDVDAVTDEQFQKWVSEVKRSTPALSKAGYEHLATPGKATPQFFSAFPEGLFNQIVNKYAVGGGHGGHGKADQTPQPSQATTTSGTKQ
ncbi:cytochrome o ubiquinol oxidase subunit 2 [Paenibacillus sp. UNCCL117]|uniref:ubiquinol oxidase subunit II n=1 Tax=unclassified Paenibacillus TaxID=185978 RepID=UPI00088C05CB|nr:MULTISPECIES: ubiquinol oxidase subunit II [unclassified Paenibacillus]SDD70892.1 cytochrome o ubiquinol oxidase subunit 2 [Paenibacillus sp. cl123]SFW45425.1 cytochrome o ubiquinol oxidase subunit 2 [Paenibacillus sp. UNCCL117]